MGSFTFARGPARHANTSFLDREVLYLLNYRLLKQMNLRVSWATDWSPSLTRK